MLLLIQYYERCTSVSLPEDCDIRLMMCWMFNPLLELKCCARIMFIKHHFMHRIYVFYDWLLDSNCTRLLGGLSNPCCKSLFNQVCSEPTCVFYCNHTEQTFVQLHISLYDYGSWDVDWAGRFSVPILVGRCNLYVIIIKRKIR